MMKISKRRVTPSATSRRSIKVNPLQPLRPLGSAKSCLTSPSGASLLKESGSKRLIVTGTVAPGRFPGLDSLLPSKTCSPRQSEPLGQPSHSCKHPYNGTGAIETGQPALPSC